MSSCTWSGVVGGTLKQVFTTSADHPDFTLTCVDGDVPCHRLILLANGGSLASRVKDRLSDNVARLDISQQNFTKKDTTAILGCLYGGLDTEMTSSNILPFVQFALHFQITWLMKAIIGKFGSVLTPQNVLLLEREPLISSSNHMVKIIDTYCRENVSSVLKELLPGASPGGVRMLLEHAKGNQEPLLLLRVVVKWLLGRNDNLTHVGSVLSGFQLHSIPRSALQGEVYNLLFNKIIIGKSDFISQQDKVFLSSLYQKAISAAEEAPVTEAQQESAKIPPPMMEVDARSPSAPEPAPEPAPAVPTLAPEPAPAVPALAPVPVPAPIQSSNCCTSINRAVTETILPYISSRSWANMEYHQIKDIIEKEDIADTEFIVVEAILLWIAADAHRRRQHCEDLLRECRFSALCPVYLRSVLTTFVSEKMLGSVRLAYSIFRTPSVPRAGKSPGRLLGVCDDIPLSVQRLKLGDHPLTFKCSCGARTQTTLTVSKTFPTAVVERLRCVCGDHVISHTAASSTLTPDVFPSLHLLPFHHLAKLLSSMDDIRVYIFV